MTLEVFNHLKAHEKTANFIAEIGAIICGEKTCKTCPMALEAKLEANGFTSGCACALLCTETMSQHDLEIVKVVMDVLDLFN